MHGYTKLFNSILHSTIWSEPNEIRILWITMLAMADKFGDIHASIPGLARMAGVTVEQCQDGLKCFLSPDSYSRTPDHEGRRIREIEGGWQLLNHGKYRALMSVEERKEYNRVKQAERRAKISATNCQKMSNSVADLSMTVNDNQQCQHITEADTDTKAEAKRESKRRPLSLEEIVSFCLATEIPKSDAEYFWDHWNGNGFTNNDKSMACWKSVIRSWKRAGHLPSQKKFNGKPTLTANTEEDHATKSF